MAQSGVSKLWRIPVIVLSILVGIVIIDHLCPIYDFHEGEPFHGESIYNPYADLDTSLGWSRTNLHTHTHATKWINECELYPDSILSIYESYGYDIVAFSNHMELTEYPGEKINQIWVYEHGYNAFQLHNLVFNPVKVCYYDILFPFLTSHKQFKMDIAARNADFIFLNHPDRIRSLTESDMRLLSGYRLTEADCSFDNNGTYLKKWDAALSSGHYVPSLISDDLHKPRLSFKIARRCSFLNVSSPEYSDVKKAMLSGNFFSIHIPDFGDGDMDVKHTHNAALPSVKWIGLHGDTACISLSTDAASIEAIGQDGELRKMLNDTSASSYVMTDTDTYIRFTARFADGTVIFSNPFARWEPSLSTSGTPYADIPHEINWPLTILYNLIVLALAAACFLPTIHLFNTIQATRQTGRE